MIKEQIGEFGLPFCTPVCELALYCRFIEMLLNLKLGLMETFEVFVVEVT
jgi:hypothetical protein